MYFSKKFLIVDNQGRNEQAILNLDGINIERESSKKYLRVIIDKLTFVKDLEYVTKKIKIELGSQDSAHIVLILMQRRK